MNALEKVKIHYFNCDCEGHHGDWILYLITQQLFQKAAAELEVEVSFTRFPKTADSLLFGGGTVLGGFYWKELYNLNKPTAVFGSGLISTNISPDLEDYLKQCFLIGVRGHKTQEWLKGYGISAKVVGDPIFSLSERKNIETSKGLVVGGVREDTLGKGLGFFKSVYKFLTEQGWNIELLRMAGNDYKDFFGYPISYKPLEETIATIGRGDLIVGQRLHMSLIGLVLGKKVLGFDYAWNKLEDALSVLNYPYYLSESSITDFESLYFKLKDDLQILVNVKDKVMVLKGIQEGFVFQILESFISRDF